MARITYFRKGHVKPRGGGGRFHSKDIGMLVVYLGYKILILVFLGSSGKFLEN